MFTAMKTIRWIFALKISQGEEQQNANAPFAKPLVTTKFAKIKTDKDRKLARAMVAPMEGTHYCQDCDKDDRGMMTMKTQWFFVYRHGGGKNQSIRNQNHHSPQPRYALHQFPFT